MAGFGTLDVTDLQNSQAIIPGNSGWASTELSARR
jgi:hypothetical protein